MKYVGRRRRIKSPVRKYFHEDRIRPSRAAEFGLAIISRGPKESDIAGKKISLTFSMAVLFLEIGAPNKFH